MPNTDQYWMQDTPSTDMEIFVGASVFRDTAALATLGSSGPGLLSLNTAAAQTSIFAANVSAMLHRTGVFATPALQQTQFGTAAGMPGPSSVANTNDPEAIRGFPPFVGANIPTLKGAIAGPVAKGIQITAVDVIYRVSGASLGGAQIEITNTVFANNVAPVVTDLLAPAGSFPSGVNTYPYRFYIPMTIQPFIIQSGSETIVRVSLGNSASSTSSFYGVVLKCNFNFN